MKAQTKQKDWKLFPGIPGVTYADSLLEGVAALSAQKKLVGGRTEMSILVDQNTRLIVQGITGREGTFHTEQMLEYGTNVVAGVTPGKGGQNVLGIPVFNTVREAVEATGANASVIFVPAMHMMSGALEAIDAGLPLVVTIAEHVPVQDMMRVYHYGRMKGTRVIGPNSFGVISPGKSKAGLWHIGFFCRVMSD